MESKPFETKDLTAMARERVQVGPPASWIDPCYYDRHFTPKLRGESTYLLYERQVHAELGQSYLHIAVRLESQRAVKAEAQRQIFFEPQTESVVLHSVKIHRGEAETEHLSLDRIQFLRRESGLEGYIISGYITLLLLLEDVRPGDILEYSFTVTARRRVMADQLTAFFTLPMGTEIGKYRFLVQHSEKRAVKWKTSSPNLTPKITTDNGLTTCYWMDVNYASPEPEGGAPVGHLMFPWIQVSDCPDWQTVARAVLSSWEKEPCGEAVDKTVEEIKNFSPDPLVRITKAIELVQDDIRYLSVNLELGGRIPSAPDIVVRRRYGDCKDLAFLLTQILRKLDVPARPVLVHMDWTKSVGSMLPSPDIFNHAIVEYEIGNEKRWVDGTAKNQGGGALNRSVLDFGFGLPLDSETTELAPVPKASLPKGTYEISESILLDTSGKHSYLAMVVTTTGFHADSLRNEYANSGIDVMAKDRAQACANRFTSVTRIKPLEIRDDRNANEFVLAEAFEIVTPILVDKFSKSCLFRIQSSSTAGQLIHPGLAARRHPLGLPYPLNHTHTVELDMPGLSSISLPIFQLGNKFFSFGRRSRSWPNRLKMVFSLETLADSIPPDKLSEHRKNVEAIHEAAVVHLQLPTGYSRNRPRWDFGALPPPRPSRAANSIVTTQKPVAPIPGPVTTEEKETVALQKTAELAGIPAKAKEMPPAREAIPLQAGSEESRSSHRRSNRSGRSDRSKMELRSAVSFYVFSASFVLTLIGGFLSYQDRILGGSGIFGGSVVMLAILLWVWSLVLACLGWKDLVKYPNSHINSKAFATLTLVFGGLMGFVYIPRLFRPAPVETAAYMKAGTEIPRPENSAKPADFKEETYVFQRPSPPWQRVDPGQNRAPSRFAYKRFDGLVFTLSMVRIPRTAFNSRQYMIDLAKSGLRQSASDFQLIEEKEVSYHGLNGWQIETKAMVKDSYNYYVEWVFTTGGYGYLLMTFGPSDLKWKIDEQAILMFENFQSTPSQNNSESSASLK